MRWSWLTNRFVVTFGGAALLAAVWNVASEPVTVVLSERTLLVAQPKGNTTTAPDGSFRFDGHQLHRIYIEARKKDIGRYGPREFRLYFKGENLDLDQPLQLAGS